MARSLVCGGADVYFADLEFNLHVEVPSRVLGPGVRVLARRKTHYIF